MRTVSTAVVLAALGVAMAQDCDPSYECKFHYQTKTHLWYYDFGTTCDPQKPNQWSPSGRSDSMTYFFQICGTVTQPCNGGQLEHGTVIQKYNPGTGDVCEVLGHGAPLYSPWASASPDSPPAGLNISFLGQAVNDMEPDVCPINPNSEVRPGRQAVFQIKCDQTVNGLYVRYIEESPTCFYNIYASSKFACAVRYTGPDASTDPTGDPDQYIGLDGGAAFGCVVGGAALAFIVWAGIGYARTGQLPFLSGRGGSGFGTGLTSSAPSPAPAFSGSSGVGGGGGYGQVA